MSRRCNAPTASGKPCRHRVAKGPDCGRHAAQLVGAAAAQDAGVTSAVTTADPFTTATAAPTWDDLGLGQSRNWWSGAGFGPQDAADWRDAGFARHTDARDWRDAGFEPAEAASWNAVDASAFEAKAWRQRDFEPDEAMSWLAATARESFGRKVTMPIHEIADWRDRGIDPSVAKSWAAHGIGPEAADAATAKSEAAGGIGAFPTTGTYADEVEAGAWAHHGISPQDAHGWQDAGMGYPDFHPGFARGWADEGFTPQEAGPWVERGILMADQATALKGQGATPDQVRDRNDGWWAAAGQWRHRDAWEQVGIDGPREAAEWNAAGFAPQNTLNWKTAGFWPKQASQWRDQGFSAADAAEWSAANYTITERPVRIGPEGAKNLQAAGWPPQSAYARVAALRDKKGPDAATEFVASPPKFDL